MKRFLVSMVVLPALAAGLLASPARGQEIIFCGMLVTHSMELDRNLLNCPDDGLVVAANRITIDLNGFTVGGRGAGSGSGIVIEDHNDVLITDGEISRFDIGLEVSGTSIRNVAEHLLIERNSLIGIQFEADRNTARSNALTANKREVVVTGDSNLFEKNRITKNRGPKSPPSFDVGGDGNRIISNRVTGGGTGVAVVGDNNSIDKNKFLRGGVHGIVVLGNLNRIRKNDAIDALKRGIWLRRDGTDGADNFVLDNDAVDNSGDGFHIDSIDTRILDNDADENGDDGFEVTGAHAYLVDNDAEENGFATKDGFGILASVPGAQGRDNDVSGNKRGCRPAKLCA